MGNVIATGPATVSSVPTPPAPDSASTLPSPPIQPPMPGPSGQTANAEAKTNSNNPGLYEDLHRKTKDIFPQIFEGAKFVVSKGLSNHFQINHTVSMSTFQPSGYRFGCTYIGKQYGPDEASPVMLGDIDINGNLNANIIHQFTKSLRTKFVTQIQDGKWAAYQSSTDYKGKDFTTSLTIGNPDIISESGIIVVHYLQKILPSLDLGAEMVYQYGQQIPGGEIAVLSIGGRYSGEHWQCSSNISPLTAALHSCYSHKINEQLTIGAELETSLQAKESLATVGYQVELPKASLTFKGQLDSNWCIGATMEKKLVPFPFTLILSGYANHVKHQYRFGLGLMVG